jgi:serine/threonine protein kinase
MKEEFTLLKYVAGPRIVQVYEYIQSEGFGTNSHMIMEYCHGGDLNDFQHRFELHGMQIPEELLRHILHQMAQAVHWIHEEIEEPILHLDIKPGNWLVQQPLAGSHFPEVKMADFGFAMKQKDIGQLNHLKCWGTPAYQPNERPRYTKAADIWAIGSTLQWLAVGKSTRPWNLEFDEWAAELNSINLEDWKNEIAKGNNLRLDTPRVVIPLDNTTDWPVFVDDIPVDGGIKPYSKALARVARATLAEDPNRRLTSSGLLRCTTLLVRGLKQYPLPEWAIPPTPKDDWGNGMYEDTYLIKDSVNEKWARNTAIPLHKGTSVRGVALANGARVDLPRLEFSKTSNSLPHLHFHR